MNRKQYTKLVLMALVGAIRPAVSRFFISLSWWVKDPIYQWQHRNQRRHVDHWFSKPVYVLNIGSNHIEILPDPEFKELLRHNGVREVERVILPPGTHQWLPNQCMIVYTDDGKEARLHTCTDRGELKQAKRAYRQEKKCGVPF